MSGANILRQRFQLLKADEGQALVLVAVGVMMLLMMAGLGLDVGWLHYQKQQMQKAADSSALAGAEALTYGSNPLTAAANDATANGYTNGQNGATVTVNHPPQTAGDPFVGNSNYIEVIIAQARPTFFMQVASLNFASANVRSRAVASIVSSGSGCIYALDPNNDAKTLLLNGNPIVTSSCGVYVNSTNSDALHINGSKAYLNAGTAGAGIGVANGGGWEPSDGSGCSGSGFCPQPVNIPQFTDPLASVSELIPTQCDFPAQHITHDMALTKGTYCGGITVSGNATVTFGAGLYTLCGGGMSVSGNVVLTGSGVTFYNTGNVSGVPNCGNYAPVSLTGKSGTSLSAPTSGTNQGILVFQDRGYISTKNNDASSVDGTAGAVFSGALYFPGTNLTFAGTPNVDVSSLIVAYQITINGNATINNHLLDTGKSPLQTAALAE